jgi:hypothetical protein
MELVEEGEDQDEAAMDTILTPSRVSEEVEGHNPEDSAPILFHSPSIISGEMESYDIEDTASRSPQRIFKGKDRLEQIPDIISPPVGVDKHVLVKGLLWIYLVNWGTNCRWSQWIRCSGPFWPMGTYEA